MDLPAFARAGDGHVDIFLRVTPNASRNAIEGAETRDDGQVRLRLRITAQPEKGKANKAAIAILAKALHLPKSAFSVISGETARDKTLRIGAVDGIAVALNGLAKTD
ncbi:DUF167 family protein [Oricola nitratireducens]|jgi:uncharacterized protein|uniref:DUF167 family protein n=1 Tax=Oricola nitratireducens TaxID=2775868 RepID=UPI001867C5A6|nr:DUF167 family protein [Oricola nitratireducens]